MSNYIDTHHHMFPPSYIAKWGKRAEAFMGGYHPSLDWNLQQSLDVLEKDDAAALLSLSCPGIWFDDIATAIDIARATNDFAADATDRSSGRLGFFAVVPWLDVDASLREIEYVYDVLHADGVGFISSYEGCYPGDARFTPIWNELNRRKAKVYFHPTTPNCCRNIVPGVPLGTLEFPFDTTRAIASLLLGLVFTLYPDIAFIFAHGGGTLPMLAGRLLSSPAVIRNERLQDEPSPGPIALLRKLYFDTASATHPSCWAALRAFTSNDRLLFGTDFPFAEVGPARIGLKSLELSEQERSAIEILNAAQLFNRFGRSDLINFR